MRTRGVVIVVSLVALVSLAAGAAGGVWIARNPIGFVTAHAKKAELDTRAFKYVSLDKVVVMLRNGAGQPAEHYLSLDLVFRTPADNEAITREQLPLLRSVAVQTLAAMTFDAAGHATIEDLRGQINHAYSQAYANDLRGKPFADAMIGKLIIE